MEALRTEVVPVLMGPSKRLAEQKRSPCSAELISTAYQPWNSIFFSQQISHSRLINKKKTACRTGPLSSHDEAPTHKSRPCSTRRYRRSRASSPEIRCMHLAACALVKSSMCRLPMAPHTYTVMQSFLSIRQVKSIGQQAGDSES
jgi:hypothetical protein